MIVKYCYRPCLPAHGDKAKGLALEIGLGNYLGDECQIWLKALPAHGGG